jgi:hypothetical protein
MVASTPRKIPRFNQSQTSCEYYFSKPQHDQKRKISITQCQLSLNSLQTPTMKFKYE